MTFAGRLSRHHISTSLSRRAALGAAVAVVAAPAIAEECRIGPPEHPHGPNVWMNMDQIELDAAYDQAFYAPLRAQIIARAASNSELTRKRLGPPRREAYGPSEVEKLDIYKTKRPKAPIFVFIHGGAWLGGESKNYAYPAEMLINAGAHYVVLDFIAIRAANGDLRVMAEQCAAPSPGPIGTRRVSVAIRNGSISAAIPWAVISAAWRSSPIGGRNLACRRPSSKAAPASGMYDMKPVRLSKRGNYVHFNDEMEQAMSSQRHLDLIRAPVVVTYGTNETPEFQRQNRDFAAALKAAGKPIELIEAANYNHFEMVESVGNPYGPNGRAVLAMMKLNAA